MRPARRRRDSCRRRRQRNTPAALCCLQAATTLYRFLAGARGGNWEEVSSNAQPQLYDANEDGNKKSPEWHLEVEGAQVRGHSRRMEMDEQRVRHTEG